MLNWGEESVWCRFREQSLLKKDPEARISWAEIQSHKTWATTLNISVLVDSSACPSPGPSGRIVSAVSRDDVDENAQSFRQGTEKVSVL